MSRHGIENFKNARDEHHRVKRLVDKIEHKSPTVVNDHKKSIKVLRGKVDKIIAAFENKVYNKEMTDEEEEETEEEEEEEEETEEEEEEETEEEEMKQEIKLIEQKIKLLELKKKITY